MNDRFRFRYFYKPLQIMYEFQEKDYLYEFAEKENYILMQCTGLKDKNGTLIYEGDIVKDDHDAWHYVKWVYNSWQLFPCTQNNYTIGIVDDEIEVIGNIYEHKELIDEQEI